ncbi:hypothetical protein A6E01_19820 (plasmid) [Vibrio breoganii]|uniref:PRTRC system protein E n=1 Tax=Vibrio breoganii TaxID=553239 RepID=A0AAN1CU90_9VIBR|nr:hypothetical protein [Vibrio breoganii]ANO35463.1 hypothetical protein A6E01_19820 [Vibrio breoganii]PML13934.1 hypothetical protein BCT84_12300 [Vibrio breoganii]
MNLQALMQFSNVKIMFNKINDTHFGITIQPENQQPLSCTFEASDTADVESAIADYLSSPDNIKSVSTLKGVKGKKKATATATKATATATNATPPSPTAPQAPTQATQAPKEKEAQTDPLASMFGFSN